MSAQLALVGGGRGRGGIWHLNPGHLPGVTGYSMSMLFSHDQGGETLEPPAVGGGPWTYFVDALGKVQ